MVVQQLANVADVTLEVDAGTTANAPFVLAQLSSVIVNNSIAVRHTCSATGLISSDDMLGPDCTS